MSFPFTCLPRLCPSLDRVVHGASPSSHLSTNDAAAKECDKVLCWPTASPKKPCAEGACSRGTRSRPSGRFRINRHWAEARRIVATVSMRWFQSGPKLLRTTNEFWATFPVDFLKYFFWTRHRIKLPPLATAFLDPSPFLVDGAEPYSGPVASSPSAGGKRLRRPPPPPRRSSSRVPMSRWR
eukprot:CAMPEP_0197458474 /NCGR_PEP_ID=MMETSP1175-20131217/48828_1 /TAXON_ID=1003142 /ORGANISM="Triceratium dubium, Strain CCMP147" /LENGTH=181 /DNA_ID=CAMNT_0042993131 /DNA_START=947 /DNA_END=1492 /DNA_ORIENTATION=-